MGGFAVTSNHSQLSVGGTNIGAGFAWRIMDMSVLRARAWRGGSVVIPTVTGRKSRHRHVDEVRYPVLMTVRGDWDSAGAAHSNPWAGLVENLAELEAELENPLGATPNTWTWTPAGAAAVTAGLWVEGYEVSSISSSTNARVAFDLVNPSGVWA